MASKKKEKAVNKNVIEVEQSKNEPDQSSIEEFTASGFKTLMEATRASNSLPQNRDWDYYCTHESFCNIMRNEGDDILQMINNILKDQIKSTNFKHRGLEEQSDLLIDTNDTILERIACNLDEFEGFRKKSVFPVEIQSVSAILPINESWNRGISSAKFIVTSSSLSATLEGNSNNASNSYRLITGKNIQRPQNYFKDRVDNSMGPWEPKITFKPNSLKPLAMYLEETDGFGEIFCHPYEFELERFEPNVELLEPIKTITVPKPLNEVPLRMVETLDDLNALVSDLRNYNELAIDLEHHSYRTYLGITCLMQISTGDTDYLIDTLLLRTELHVLNELFTKPTIVKVFHGADSDVEWLQRDLSLYVVNMFDTHQAAKQLEYPHLSLAYLLRKFCQIDANKHFQLADWRIRPLPDELKIYAREDTHYLLYIYHMMRNELLTKANGASHLLRAIIQRSTDICRKRYNKPIFRDDSHLELYRKYKKLFDNRQMYALKELYKWRDKVARLEDESLGFVLPNHMLLQIAELLPREMQGILACCNPIPPLVRTNLLEMHKIILDARDQSVIKPILREGTTNNEKIQLNSVKINIDSPLNCPHDLIRSEEFRDDLPTLLNREINNLILPVENCQATIVLFDSDTDNTETERVIKRVINKVKSLGPYERYKRTKSYIQAIEAEKEKKQPVVYKEQKTDEERVETLRQHFIKEATVAEYIIPLGITPASPMNVTSKKRKRKETTETNSIKADKKRKKIEEKLETINITQRQRQDASNTNTKPQSHLSKINITQRQSQDAPNTNPKPQSHLSKRQKRLKKNQIDGVQPFDYKSVDFRKFQGGSGVATGSKRIQFKNNKRFKNKRTGNFGQNYTKSDTLRLKK